jgi:hypothetical protein
MAKLTPAGYRLYIRNSKKKHILVEGKTDKVAFDYIKTSLKINEDIEVESAENLVKFEDINGNVLAIGNREKVESISQSIVEQSHNYEISGKVPYANKYVGFADREMRDFIIGDSIQDALNSHKVLNRLVWSRGHSIENYLLDLKLLSEPFNIFSPEYSIKSHELLEAVWISMLRLSCAASLTAIETEKLSLITNTINWEILEIDPPHIQLNTDHWKQKLIGSNLLEDNVNEIIERFIFWSGIFDTVGLPLLRWICHGHIVFNILWNSFAVCTYVLSNDEKLTKEILRDKEIRYKICAHSWSKNVTQDDCEYPSEVFRLLGYEK